MGCTAVPTTLAVTGNYGQMMAFVNGLDTFPRLFVIHTFVLSTGATSSSTSRDDTVSSGSAARAPEGLPCGPVGRPPRPRPRPYNLAITGSIYYTSTPNALAACTKATAEVKKG